MEQISPPSPTLAPEGDATRRVGVWGERYGWRLFGWLASVVILVVIVGFGVLVARLSRGPIDAGAFAPRVVAALEQRLGPGYSVQIGAMSVVRQAYGLAFAMDGFAIATNSGHKIVAAPRAEIYLHPLSLLFGMIKPNRIDVYDLTVSMRVLPNGAVSVSADENDAAQNGAAVSASQKTGQPPGAPAPLPAVRRAEVLKQAGAAIDAIFDLAASADSPIAKLDHLGIERGRLIFIDELADQSRTFNDLQFSLDRRRGAATIDVAATGSSGRWRVKGLTRGPRLEAHQIDVEATGFSIDEIRLIIGARAGGVDSDMPLSAKFDASFGVDGSLVSANARFAFGAGFYRFDDPDFEPVFVDEFVGSAHWDPNARTIAVDQIDYFSGQTRLFFNGSVKPPQAPGAPWSITLALAEPGFIGPERNSEKPTQIDKLIADLLFDPDARRIEFQHMAATGPELGAAASGSFDWNEGPHLRLGASASRCAMRSVLAFWPSFGAAPVRAWLAAHVLGGTLQSGTLAIDFNELDLRMMRAQHPPPDASVAAEYVVSDGALTYLSGAPPLSGVNGRGRTTGRTSVFNASSAYVDLGAGHRLDLANGSVVVPNAAQIPTPLKIAADVKGGVDTLAELLAKPAFAGYAALPLAPETVKGQIDGHFGYDTKIGQGANPKEGVLSVVARVENFSAEKLVGKEKLDQGALDVFVDHGEIRASGTGHIFGAPATIELKRIGVEPGVGSIGFVLDDAARAKAGVTLGAALSGPVGVHLATTFGEAHAKANVALDFTRAVFDQPIPGLFKPAGRPSKASFLYRDEDNGASLEQIVFDGAGPQARGVAQLGADGSSFRPNSVRSKSRRATNPRRCDEVGRWPTSCRAWRGA